MCFGVDFEEGRLICSELGKGALSDFGEVSSELMWWCGPRIASMPLPRYVVRGD